MVLDLSIINLKIRILWQSSIQKQAKFIKGTKEGKRVVVLIRRKTPVIGQIQVSLLLVKEMGAKIKYIDILHD